MALEDPLCCCGSLLTTTGLQVDQMEMEAKGKAKLMILVRKYKGEVKVWKNQVVSRRAWTAWRRET